MRYDGTSTKPVKKFLEQIGPERNDWNSSFDQTYSFSTSGDIDAYTVEALLRDTSSTGHVRTIRVGATAPTPKP